MLRFIGDVWKNHACCVATAAPSATSTNAPSGRRKSPRRIVKAQLWTRSNRLDSGEAAVERRRANKYTPHALPKCSAKVLAASDYASYDPRDREAQGRGTSAASTSSRTPTRRTPSSWCVRLRETRIEGDNAFLETLDPAFAARDLVDDSFVRKAIAKVGGLPAFGLPADFARQEVLAP